MRVFSLSSLLLTCASAAAVTAVSVGCTAPESELFHLEDTGNFPDGLDNTPQNNPQTAEGVALGRVLFYDTLLSENGAVSCASCHQQDAGFSDVVVTSEGFNGGQTRRNSMALINVRFYEPGTMFWDERAATLEDQVLMPIFDEIEMGLDEAELLSRVREAGYYAPLFTTAFGDEEVTSDRIAMALAQFVRSIVSSASKWDEALAQAGDLDDNFALFTAQENEGKRLFFAGGGGSCASCHLRGGNGNRNGGPDNGQNDGPGGQNGNPVAEFVDALGDGAAPGGQGGTSVFLMNQARHNGLSIENGDQGVFEATGNRDDIGKFKSPSLRNVELTAPYMHDGRFETLEEVIEHYNSGVVMHDNLDNRLRRGNAPRRLNLDDEEKAALVAFLRTLTDPTIATNPRFSDPFSAGELQE